LQADIRAEQQRKKTRLRLRVRCCPEENSEIVYRRAQKAESMSPPGSVPGSRKESRKSFTGSSRASIRGESGASCVRDWTSTAKEKKHNDEEKKGVQLPQKKKGFILYASERGENLCRRKGGK